MHDATAAAQPVSANKVANRAAHKPRLHLLRHDTLLGACQAVGDTLGFNPALLRVALCAALFWNFAIVIGGYVALAALIVLIDLLVPTAGDAAEAAPIAARAAGKESASALEPQPERELIAA